MATVHTSTGDADAKSVGQETQSTRKRNEPIDTVAQRRMDGSPQRRLTTGTPTGTGAAAVRSVWKIIQALDRPERKRREFVAYIPTVSINEAADRLGVHPNTIRNWTDNKTIACIRKPGSNFRQIPESEVHRLISERMDNLDESTKKTQLEIERVRSEARKYLNALNKIIARLLEHNQENLQIDITHIMNEIGLMGP